MTLVMHILFTRYFSFASSAEPGTLSFLRNIANCRNVTGHVSKEMNAVDDFLQSVLHAYAAVAMVDYFSMESTDSKPILHCWNAPLQLSTAECASEAKWNYLSSTLKQLVSTNIMPCLNFSLADDKTKTALNTRSTSGIQNYAWSLLVAEEFKDATNRSVVVIC